jgi:hypothetical protein
MDHLVYQQILDLHKYRGKRNIPLSDDRSVFYLMVNPGPGGLDVYGKNSR